MDSSQGSEPKPKLGRKFMKNNRMSNIVQRCLSFPGRLYRAARASKLWIRAIDHMTKQEYDAALACLDCMKSFTKPIAEAEIMKGSALYASFRNEDAIDQFKTAWKKLGQDKTLRQEDKIYLMVFISKNAFDAAEFADLDIDTVKKIDLRAVNLEAVSGWCKRLFPIRDHPDWSAQQEG